MIKKVIPYTFTPGTKVELVIRIVDYESRHGVRRFPAGSVGVIKHSDLENAVVEMKPTSRFSYPLMIILVPRDHLRPCGGGRRVR